MPERFMCIVFSGDGTNKKNSVGFEMNEWLEGRMRVYAPFRHPPPEGGGGFPETPAEYPTKKLEGPPHLYGNISTHLPNPSEGGGGSPNTPAPGPGLRGLLRPIALREGGAAHSLPRGAHSPRPLTSTHICHTCPQPRHHQTHHPL